jgi:hypothetical protein
VVQLLHHMDSLPDNRSTLLLHCAWLYKLFPSISSSCCCLPPGYHLLVLDLLVEDNTLKLGLEPAGRLANRMNMRAS